MFVEIIVCFISFKLKLYDSQWNDAQVARSVHPYFNLVIYPKVNVCFQEDCKSFRFGHKQ